MSDPTLVQNIPAAYPAAPVTPPIPDPIPSAPRSPWIGIILGLFIVACGSAAAYFWYFKSSSEPKDSSDTVASASPSPIATKLPEFAPLDSAAETLVYITDDDNEKPGDEEIWLINPVTKKETKLPLTKAVQAFKYYGQTNLYYSVTNDRGEYHVLDLATGVDTVYDLLDHTDKTASVSISLNDINHISPDGKYLVFSASFFTVCPSPSPFPSGFEGGFGPCGPEESLETPSGYYLYDFANHKTTFLGSVFRISRWDTVKHKLYVTDYENGNHTKAIDLVSKTVATIDSTQSFGYFLYPLLATNQLVKFEGATGDSGTPAFGKIYLLNADNLPGPTIDTSPTWTDIQPFITSSPTDSDILYRRSVNVDGLHHNSIYRYNLATSKASRLSKDQSYLSYNIYVSWIDDHTLVTSVDPIEKEQYNSGNQYLVKIDLYTGEETRLTTTDNIQRFNSQ